MKAFAAFCFHSLLREYGWQFAWRVVLPHPVRTLFAVIRSARLDYSRDMTATCSEDPVDVLMGERSIVGVGFCLKPIDPPCPSGRANHDCVYLERLGSSAQCHTMPEACRDCRIRQIGTLSLRAGTAFYIMTSARDILFDLFAPALSEARFTSGLFTLCRYSRQPFAVGLFASGIRGWMLPFETGDCREYGTWLLADRGVKYERTSMTCQNRHQIQELLGAVAKPGTNRHSVFERRGNILYPA